MELREPSAKGGLRQMGKIKENTQIKSENFDRFIEMFARAVGTSKEGLNRILFQGQNMKQARRSPRSGNVKRNDSRQASL